MVQAQLWIQAAGTTPDFASNAEGVKRIAAVAGDNDAALRAMCAPDLKGEGLRHI